MNHRRIFCFVLCSSLLFTSGCWDRKELNDRGIWLATGWDVWKKDKVQISGQMLIPSSMQTEGSSGGSSTKGYLTVSATGKNVRDAVQNIQTKLSRQAFFGQRRVAFFGEEFAKRGLKNELDASIRDPAVSFRVDTFVVKGGTALEMLDLSYPLEKIPTGAASKELEQFEGRAGSSFIDFLIAANSEGMHPTLPAIEIGHFQNKEDSGQGDSSNTSFQLAGAALFDDDLKLRGFLNMDEDRILLWVLGVLNKQTIAVPLKDGNASLILTKMGSKIVPEISHDKQIKFTVTLTGQGSLLENNSNLDLMQTKNVEFLQHALEKQTKKQVLQTIKKVQEKYGLDIFGFGEAIHKKDPSNWKSLKKNWDETFSKADVSVNVHLTIRQMGLTGPSLLYEESEIKK